MPKSWYSQAILDNGLRVLVAPTDSPSATIVFMAKTGSKQENPAQAGISHFLEHFVFKGTAKYPTSRDVMRALDQVGADHNAATGKEYTYYWVKTSAAHVSRAMEMIGEIVFRPKLPAPLLSREKGTIIQEIAMYDDHPMLKISDRFETLVFGSTNPLGREIIGTRETVRALTRAQLVAYRDRQYRPDTTVVAVAGGVRQNEVLRYAEKYFDEFPGEKFASPGELQRGKPAATHRGKPASTGHEGRRLVDWKKTDQAHLELGLRTFGRRDPRRYALSVLTTLLGGNASSLLFEEIREKRGLAYYIRSGVTAYETDGYLGIAAGVPPGKAAEVEVLIRELLGSFRFSQQELTDAREYLKGHLALSWEESQSIAEHLVEDFLFEPRIRSFAELNDAVDRIRALQVRALADELFGSSPALSVAAIGPIDQNLKLKMKNLK